MKQKIKHPRRSPHLMKKKKEKWDTLRYQLLQSRVTADEAAAIINSVNADSLIHPDIDD